jgi:hypothetical protein
MFGSISITIFIACITSEFKSAFYFTAEIWNAIFIIVFAITLLISIYLLIITRKMSISDDDFFNDLKNPDK